MDCPLCNHQDINPLVMHCPSCDADLAVLRMVGTIEEQYVDAVKGRITTEGALMQTKKEYEAVIGQQQSRFNKLILLLLLLPLMQWICGKKSPPPIVQEVEVAVPQTDSLNSLRSKIALQEKTIDALKAQKGRTIRYLIREGDNLESIGYLFFNDRKAGYQIGKDNRISNENRLTVGDTLLINVR